jgi:PAS domain S-box-containing protein
VRWVALTVTPTKIQPLIVGDRQTNVAVPMHWKKISFTLSLMVIGLGALVLAGWGFGIDALKRIHPQLVAMKANTAACLVLAGTSLALLQIEVGGVKRRLGQLCALGILIVGALTLSQYLTGRDLGIDQFLFPESLKEAGPSIPGRMNPASAVNFILLGIALLWINSRTQRGWTPAQVCVAAVTGLTLVIFLTYFYNVELIHPVELNASIALHTVIAFLLLCVGILLARPRRGIMVVFLSNTAAGIVARRLIPTALLAPALLGWLRVLGQREGLFGTGFGTAMLVTALTLIFTLLIWWTACALENVETARTRLAAIVESSDDAIVSKNLDGVVTSWNAGAERLFGWSAAEMIGQPILKIIPRELQDEEKTILRRLRAGEHIEHFETRREAKDGRRMDVSLTISPVRDREGTIIGASKISRDITRQKQTEAALVDQRQWFAVTLSSIGDAVIATDAKGVVTFLNPMAEAMTGWVSGDAIGLPLEEIFRIINEKTHAKAEHPVGRVLREGAIVGLANHTALLSRDGRVISIEDSAAPIKDSQGTVIGVVMVFHDVTEQRQIETARAERERLMVLRAGIAVQIASANELDGLLQSCCELLVRHFDAALASIWMLNENEPVLEMRASAGLYPQLDGSQSRLSIGKARIGRIAEARQPNFTTDLLRDPDMADSAWIQREGVVAFGGYPLILENRLVGVLAIFLRRKLSQTEFEDLSPIADGVAQLIERKRADTALHAAKDRAESASKAKDQFLAALSHELRTPLTPVLMLAGAMERSEELAPQVRRDFAMIRQNVELEARIIDDLLDLTRITQGKLVLRFEQVDPHLLIAHALDILRHDIEEKKLDVKLDFAATEHHVTADAVRLEQVFWNVLKNAVKFTPNGGRLSVCSSDADGHLRVSVADNGIGITPEELPRIFNAFAQGAEAEAPRFGGLGLGLSISALLVNEHRGRIWAESSGRDQGATFHIELPLVPESGPVPSPAVPAPLASAGPLHILLVEDHQTTRETLTRLLARSGHRIESANCVAQALEVAAQKSFDLVISDLGLPDGDGHGLMRALRRDFGLRGIALSGYGMQSDIEKSSEAGFVEHLTKPIDLTALEEAIQRTHASRRSPTAASDTTFPN